ncbi:hypothetical protein GCM10014719_38150 [Planomonospora parontospora subsp. antibiotica]|nr:hypothetical protein GCM10014719_38150 [Planomonospora parontospora subsp. antibiotica]
MAAAEETANGKAPALRAQAGKEAGDGHGWLHGRSPDGVEGRPDGWG